MKIGEFILENENKLHRAINGTVGKNGAAEGGVGEKAADEDILAAYDKLGGLITKEGNKVKIGSFYDFAKKTKREVPEVLLEFRDIDGDVVELGVDEDLPIEVKAARLAKKTKSKKAKAEK